MTSPLDPSQLELGDMSAAEFRKRAHQVADLAADYLERLTSYPVTPPIVPGAVRDEIPTGPPAQPESIERILEDYTRLIEPNLTHWQHPAFLAYFSSTASGPGILGEWLAAVTNSNVMFWKNAPASTELEEVVVDWLRQALGLPNGFDGMLTDTASISTLLSIVAAREEVPKLAARDQGLAGRDGIGRLRLYCSEEAHSSIEKAAIVTGIGRAGVRRIPTDEELRMIPAALDEAIREDRRSGWWPVAIAATLGTTSSTSIDPVAEIAEIARREKIWLHVDAAYGGTAAIVPEMRPLFAGWELADSIVVNPHKWMFTPFDASLLLFRRPETYRRAMSLMPEYLVTRKPGQAHDYHEYGIQLGRRFRALKLWMILRWFGTDGLARRLREHCRLARELAEEIDRTEGWARLAPTPLATVCFHFCPPGQGAEAIDRLNESILERVNESGRVYLSHTRIAGRFTIRLTIGNPRTEGTHVEQAWKLLRETAASVT